MMSLCIQLVLGLWCLLTNLLSILYLTCHKQFTVHIDSDEMRFMYNTLLFTAQINENNAAFLDGTTDANLEAAHSVLTLPLDLTLWHRHLMHHDHNSVRQMISKELVTGLKIELNEPPDPICEPCLSGKMNAHTFPSSTTCSSKPLELIHTDLHGPFKMLTTSGYCYWVTFINDCTQLHCIIFLKLKNETFTVFK